MSGSSHFIQLQMQGKKEKRCRERNRIVLIERYSSVVFLTPIRDVFLMGKEAQMLNTHVARSLRVFIRKEDNAVFNKRLIIYGTHTHTHVHRSSTCLTRSQDMNTKRNTLSYR